MKESKRIERRSKICERIFKMLQNQDFIPVKKSISTLRNYKIEHLEFTFKQTYYHFAKETTSRKHTPQVKQKIGDVIYKMNYPQRSYLQIEDLADDLTLRLRVLSNNV